MLGLPPGMAPDTFSGTVDKAAGNSEGIFICDRIFQAGAGTVSAGSPFIDSLSELFSKPLYPDMLLPNL